MTPEQRAEMGRIIDSYGPKYLGLKTALAQWFDRISHTTPEDQTLLLEECRLAEKLLDGIMVKVQDSEIPMIPHTVNIDVFRYTLMAADRRRKFPTPEIQPCRSNPKSSPATDQETPPSPLSPPPSGSPATFANSPAAPRRPKN